MFGNPLAVPSTALSRTDLSSAAERVAGGLTTAGALGRKVSDEFTVPLCQRLYRHSQSVPPTAIEYGLIVIPVISQIRTVGKNPIMLCAIRAKLCIRSVVLCPFSDPAPDLVAIAGR